MNLELFREKVRYYRPLTERTQEDLANALGLSPYVLSHKLHGTRNARLTHREVQAIVKTLVEWGAMTRQAEARELLELMDCPDFLPDEWNAPPFTWLEATTSTRSVPLRTTRSPDVEHAVPVQRSRATRPIALESRQEAIASPPLRRDWGEAIEEAILCLLASPRTGTACASPTVVDEEQRVEKESKDAPEGSQGHPDGRAISPAL